MQVQSIQNNHHNPNFNGYVHKSVKTYIGNTVKTECNRLVADANNNRMEVDKDALKNIVALGKRVLNKLNTFVEPQHKKTAIKFNDADALTIENPIANPIRLFGAENKGLLRSDLGGDASIGISEKIYYDKPTLNKLGNLEKTADELLNTVKPNDVDNAFLTMAEDKLKYNAMNNNGTGIFGRLKTLKQAKAVDKFGKEIGAETTAKKDAESYIRYVTESKQKRDAMIKRAEELEKRNSQALKDVLNEK